MELTNTACGIYGARRQEGAMYV